ncbi:hypothetical protein [Amycolatopsis sp. 195334CR]|uniref:hypothetical protein n=1 Tax=Amycolatopsis sp. 195334CR TaxID=2814588 RepID=UPI001A8FA75D|nr:hypothetical protein [Amycolatopsis sp. 195334CR]MBN6036951.1 hypothetical protein [Amycolatopsis sp. 195334CR]
MDKQNVVELPREDNVVLVIDRFDQWHNPADGVRRGCTGSTLSVSALHELPEAA